MGHLQEVHLMISLTNTKHAMPFETTEYHHLVCNRRKECKCACSIIAGPRGKATSQKLPRSFRINGKETREGLDDEVLFLPAVKEAIDSGWLQLTRVPKVDKIEAKSKTEIKTKAKE